MERFRKLWRQEPAYERLGDNLDADELNQVEESRLGTRVEYGIFLLLGVSMLWAYNMFLAAGPYFQQRFENSAWISENFQAAEISVSTTTSLVSMLILTRLQAGASYPKRILSSLFLNMLIFTLLACSTKLFPAVSARGYFAFIMFTNFLSSLATSLCQNGVFAYISGFGQPSYTQGIMTGQGIAGVLPCVAQIISVLSLPEEDHLSLPNEETGSDQPPPAVPSSAALIYFLTATAVSIITLLAFAYLLSRQKSKPAERSVTLPDSTNAEQNRPLKAVPLRVLAYKLRWLAGAVFMTFAITMVFPVFTQRILSVRPTERQPRILRPASFVPLAFLLWNAGDFLGRLLTAVPSLALSHRPQLLFSLSIARLVFPALYMLCNIRGRGAAIQSDAFYLIVVQLLFGMTNGFLGTSCMMGAADWVDTHEQEAAGSFMALCLVAGLTAGSLASFLVATT